MGASNPDRVPDYATTAIPVARARIPLYVTWMFCLYLVLLPAAELVLRWVNALAGSSEINRDRAIFAVVNAATLTGFQSIIGIDTYPPAAQGVILALSPMRSG